VVIVPRSLPTVPSISNVLVNCSIVCGLFAAMKIPFLMADSFHFLFFQPTFFLLSLLISCHLLFCLKAHLFLSTQKADIPFSIVFLSPERERELGGMPSALYPLEWLWHYVGFCVLLFCVCNNVEQLCS
jgi:hypothetical protein